MAVKVFAKMLCCFEDGIIRLRGWRDLIILYIPNPAVLLTPTWVSSPILRRGFTAFAASSLKVSFGKLSLTLPVNFSPLRHTSLKKFLEQRSRSGEFLAIN